NGTTLTKVGNMEVQWKKHASVSAYSGGAITREDSFDTSTHAVNVDETNCYASYRCGTPYTVTVQNGTLTGPGVPNASGSGMFLENDTVSIKADTKTGNSGETIPFKGWTSSNVTLTSPTTASNSFTVPGKDVTVTAMHNPFDGAPTFTPTGSTNTTGTLTFKTVVKPHDGNEYFRLVKDGEQNDESKYISFREDNSPSTSPYEYSYETRSLPGVNQVDEGDYYVVEKLNGTYYLSEKFTVNYVKPRPEISVSYWPDPTVFTSVEVGYDFATGRTLTIDNKGTADTGPLTITVEGANPEAFTVSPSTISNIAAGKSAMSTVRPATGLPAGTYTATLKISGDNVNTLSINMKFTVKDPNASATVGGTITSYGNASEAVTVTLLQGTSVIGSPQVLTGASGSAPYSQTYSFPTVPAGEYTLKVEKKGHAPWTEEITVGTDNIGKDVTVYLWGDVNRDGEVTAADAQEIQRKAAGLSSVFDTDPNSAYCMLRADVNRDGAITAADAQEIQRKAAGLSSTISTLP
ncbi:dockerin type I domain-containing protein, partial [Eubacteriales bacterium SGI.150]